LRGGGDDKGDDALAMALMGYGKGGGPEARALDERTQAAVELFQQGQLANMAEGRRIDELKGRSEAEARTAGIADTAEQRKVAAQNELQRQKELADSLERAREIEARATAKGLLDTLVKENRMAPTDPEYIRLAERAMPGYKAESEQLNQADRESKITKGLTTYQKADPKAKAQYAKDPATMGAGITPDVYGEILKRAGVNVAQPGAPASVTAPTGGVKDIAADVLWNLPGGVENLFRMGANLGSSAWYGKGAPQYELMPWTHAADEGPKVG
jgi:hypothetical protein